MKMKNMNSTSNNEVKDGEIEMPLLMLLQIINDLKLQSEILTYVTDLNNPTERQASDYKPSIYLFIEGMEVEME